MITQAYKYLIIPGFETIVKRRRIYPFLRELEETQWWSHERLKELQLRRLRDMLAHCESHSPYYRTLWRSLGLDARQLQTLDDFHRWPITRRQVMHDQRDRIQSNTADSRVVTKATGGSSGAPLRFVIDCDADERRMAAACRGYSWAGAVPGTRQSYLWGVNFGNPSRIRRWKEYVYTRWLYRRDVLNVFELSDETIPKYLARLHQFRPEVLVAYTNPLYEFARVLESRGLRPYRPRAIVVGAERLHGFQRELMERVFDAPVFETYGSREFTLIGAECGEHCGLHLTMENLVVEIVDEQGRPTPAGKEGTVVITDLFNIAMPFVRYAIGDRAIAGFEQCSCGRGLPLLKKVVGRQLDVLVTADGRRIAGEFFPHLLKDYGSVRRFQVIQRRRDLVELKLVVDASWQSVTREKLLREVRQTLGPSTHAVIREVEEIPLTGTGKWRVVVSHDSLVRQSRTAS